MKRRIISLILLTVILAGVVSCGKNPAEDEKEAKTIEAVLGSRDKLDYTVIFPENYTRGEGKTVNIICNALSDLCTYTVSPRDDFLKKNTAEDPLAKEIVFGVTNRAVSAEADGRLVRDKDFTIIVGENKIAVYSRDKEGLSLAADYFCSHISEKDGNIVLTVSEDCYVPYDYPALNLRIGGAPVSGFVIVIPEGSETDQKSADILNDWMYQNVGLRLPVCVNPPETACEILIGKTGRPESEKYYKGEKALAKNNYAMETVGTKVVLAYNGFGGTLPTHLTDYLDANKSCDGMCVVSSDSAYELFRNDNYAAGRWSRELLNSVNPGVMSLLSECTYYQDRLLEGIKLGQKWVYSNSSAYVPQGGTFDAMVKSGKRGGNCASPQSWFFTETKIIPGGSHVYGNSSGEIANIGSEGKYIGAVATITRWAGRYTFGALYEHNMVKPGDIFYCTGHTFIYLGDRKFMAAGHDSDWHSDPTAETEDSRHAVFDNWIKPINNCSDYNWSVNYQVRLKDEFVPMYYRNSKGELVKTPIYDEKTSIMYKRGVSSESYEVIEGKIK